MALYWKVFGGINLESIAFVSSIEKGVAQATPFFFVRRVTRAFTALFVRFLFTIVFSINFDISPIRPIIVGSTAPI